MGGRGSSWQERNTLVSEEELQRPEEGGGKLALKVLGGSLNRTEVKIKQLVDPQLAFM